MITASEFVRRWKYSELCRPPEDVEYDLPFEHLAFLKEAGLPTRTHILVRFEAVEQGLPRLSGVAEPGREYVLLGTPPQPDKLETHFCLELKTGVVFAFVPIHAETLVFVNSSVIAFAESLLLYVDSFLCVPPEDMHEDIPGKFDASEKIWLQIGAIDPPVLESSDYFWYQQLHWNALDMGSAHDILYSDELDW